MNAIEIENLTKCYGDVKAVDNISFTVPKGVLFAFLGVNGAGKSTTISILCSALKKDSGKVLVGGKDPGTDSSVKGEIGIVFQQSVLDKSLSVYDNLKCRASLYGILGDAFEKRLESLSELLDFKAFMHRPIGKLSGGQARRIDIARALIHNPRILILDEPTTGLDPQTRKKLWDVIAYLRKTENTTVFLTTHYMEEAAEADNVVIIDSGRIIAQGTPLQLKNKYTDDYITLYGADEAKVKALGVSYQKQGENIIIKVADTGEATKLILSMPDLFTDYEITKGKMDDVFLAATGKRAGGEDK